MSVGVRVRWATAFLDVPAAHLEASRAFWCAVTGTRLSAPRGERGEVGTFLPDDRADSSSAPDGPRASDGPGGDAFLRWQRLEDGPRVHLDLHVGDDGEVREALAAAVALGAELRHDAGTHVVLASPGGFVFCLVRDDGERVRPGPVEGELLDQLCLDVPSARVDAEAELAFWSSLTGWSTSPSRGGSDFLPLVRPVGIPLRLMLQRLGGDDDRPGVTGHPDLASGPDRAAAIARHVSLGAVVVGEGPRWTTLRDPAGLAYCLTDRLPETGLLPDV